MNKLKLRNTYLPLVFIFIAINAFCLIFKERLDERGVDHSVVQGANLILFSLAVVSAFMHYRAVSNSNPHAFVRSIMGATVLKLIIIAGSVFIYLYFSGSNKSIYAVLTGMGLYIIYTIFEVAGAFRLNKHSNGRH